MWPYCRACGRELQSDDRFCIHCGMKMEPNDTELEKQLPPGKEDGKNQASIQNVKRNAPSKKRTLSWTVAFLGGGGIALLLVVFLVQHLSSQGASSEMMESDPSKQQEDRIADLQGMIVHENGDPLDEGEAQAIHALLEEENIEDLEHLFDTEKGDSVSDATRETPLKAKAVMLTWIDDTAMTGNEETKLKPEKVYFNGKEIDSERVTVDETSSNEWTLEETDQDGMLTFGPVVPGIYQIEIEFTDHEERIKGEVAIAPTVEESTVYLHLNESGVNTISSYEEITLQKKEEADGIQVNYPVFGYPRVDAQVKAYTEEKYEAFEQLLQQNQENLVDGSDRPAFYHEFNMLDYEIFGEYISISFTEYVYEGGAHGMYWVVPHTYELETGMQIDLNELFERTGSTLERLAEVVNEKLVTGQIEGATTIDPLEVKEENFQYFSLQEDGLTIHFQLYHLAPYAHGILDVDVSWEELDAEPL